MNGYYADVIAVPKQNGFSFVRLSYLATRIKSASFPFSKAALL